MSQDSIPRSKGTILAVDDTPINLHLLTEMLSEQGYKVRITPNGKLALKSVLSNPPDLILLDIQMPEMDGYEVCKTLKADERTKNIPVIFLRALDETFDQVKAFEAGGVDYITKPFQIVEVLARIENQLRLRTQEKQLSKQKAWLQEEIRVRQQAQEALRESETRYRELVEAQNQVLVCRWNPDSSLTFVNQSYCRFFGKSSEELLGTRFLDLLPDQPTRTQVREFVRSLLYTLCPTTTEYLMRSATREVRWFRWTDQPILDQEGHLVEVQSFGIDITESKRAQEALAASERQYRNLVETSQDIIWSVDDSGQYTFVNQAVKHIYGYEPFEMIGCPFTDFVAPEEIAKFQVAFQDVVRGKKLFQHELVSRTKDGRLINLMVNAIALRDAEGKVIGATGTASDITERKQREEALRSLVEGTASATGDTFMRSCVRHLARALQVRYALIAECVGKACTQIRTLAFWTGETWGETFEYNLADTPCEIVLEGQACYYPQDVQTLFPNDPHLVQLTAQSYFGVPLIDSSGNTLGFLAVLDVKPMERTPDNEMILKIFAARAGAELERLRAEEARRRLSKRERDKTTELELTLKELRRTQSQLIQVEKLSSLGRTIGGIAHEINNPISFIWGNLTPARQYFQDLNRLIELYQKTYPNPTPEIRRLASEIDLAFMVEDWSKLMNSIEAGAERIHRIIQSLKLFSRLHESELKTVDIHENIDNTLFILQHRLRAGGGRPEIKVIKNYGQLPRVSCYVSQLNQVFMNLLNNAIDALESQPPPRVVTVSTSVVSGKEQRTPNFIIIRIADNGPGMSEDVQQKVFDPFFTTKPVGSGTGLGLSISHQIVVEKHRGQLRCISAPGQGTELIVKIPIQQEHLLPNGAHSDNLLVFERKREGGREKELSV